MWRQKPQDFAPAEGGGRLPRWLLEGRGGGRVRSPSQERVALVLERSQRPGGEAQRAVRRPLPFCSFPSEGKLFLIPGKPGVFPCHSCWVTCVT